MSPKLRMFSPKSRTSECDLTWKEVTADHHAERRSSGWFRIQCHWSPRRRRTRTGVSREASRVTAAPRADGVQGARRSQPGSRKQDWAGGCRGACGLGRRHGVSWYQEVAQEHARRRSRGKEIREFSCGHILTDRAHTEHLSWEQLGKAAFREWLKQESGGTEPARRSRGPLEASARDGEAGWGQELPACPATVLGCPMHVQPQRDRHSRPLRGGW